MTAARSPRWPTGTDYSMAVQSPKHAFTADELTSAEPVISALGVPMAATGQNAVVFLLRDVMQRSFALRCFTTPSSDGAQRYQALAAHLATVPVTTPLAQATWIADGVHVGDGTWPVVLMPWVPGKAMNLAVEDRLEDDNHAGLVRLADQWSEAVHRLQAASIAHGDLQHGNALVAEDEGVVLVDLDGVWVPDAGIAPPNEIGHPNYQHPGRTTAHWGRYVDSFSALLIDTSLRALAADPSLGELMGGESLVVARPDLTAPARSAAFDRMSKSSDERVRRQTAVLLELLAMPFETALRPFGDLLLEVPTESVTTTRAPALPNAPVFGSPVASVDPLANWWESGQPAVVGSAGVGVGNAPSGTTVVSASTPDSGRSGWLSQALIGAMGGVYAGVLGCFVYGLVALHVPPLLRPPTFVSIISALTGLFVLGLPPLLARQPRLFAKRGATGLAVGAVCGAIAVMPAALVMRSLVDLPAGLITEDPPPLPIALVWSIVALVVGLGLGIVQSRRAALLAGAAGAVAGFAGGMVYGLTVAEFQGSRLVIAFGYLSTNLAVALVCALIGIAVAVGRKAGALASIIVIEGPYRGRQALLKKTASIGSDPRLNDLCLPADGVLPVHVRLVVEGGRCTVETLGPVGIAGHQLAATATIASGTVLAIGPTFVRIDLRDSNEDNS